MADKDKEEKRKHYAAERARALALIYLTERPDLRIVETQNDVGLDFTVYIHGENHAGVRLFGVKLRGAWSTVPKKNANNVIGRSVRETQQCGPFPFPVCLFFFTMEETQGWHTWVAEPVVDPEKGSILKSHQDASCEELTDQAVDEIVNRVNLWYDAKFAQMV